MSSADELTRGLRTLVLGSHHHRGGGGDLSRRRDLTTDGLVANSLLTASPNPMATPHNLSDMMWDEELPDTHWPLDDEILFYSSSGGSGGGGGGGGNNSSGIYFDLNVSIPVIVPNTEIRILNSEGENYYHSTNDDSVNLLFGQYEGLEHSDEQLSGNGNGSGGGESSTTTSPDTTTTTTCGGGGGFEVVEAVRVEDRLPITICDVWASFLHVEVGRIKNCRYDNIQEITEMFLETFDSMNFLKPINIQCSGIFHQSAGKNNRLETRGRFCNTEDLSRFRILRRALKLFCLKLRQKFSVVQEGDYNKQFHASISPVCKTGAYLPIEIRRYSALDKQTLQLIQQAASGNSGGGGNTTTTSGGGGGGNTTSGIHTSGGSDDQPIVEIGSKRIPLQTHCLLNDIRLEMTHARAVDPRWTKSWVLCRRMPMTARIIPGRKVFSQITPPESIPKILYQFNNPKQKLQKSRFGPLYMLTESALNLNTTRQQQHQSNPILDLFLGSGNRDHHQHLGGGTQHQQIGGQQIGHQIGQRGGGHYTKFDQQRARKEILRAVQPDQQNSIPQNRKGGGVIDDSSQMRAEAVPFFPLTALAPGLDDYTKANAILEELKKCAYHLDDDQTRWEEEVMEKIDDYISSQNNKNTTSY